MKLFKQTFTVSGSYPFPMDMLRYDRACPDTETDSGVIARSIEHPYDKNYQVSVLRYVTEKTNLPTSERWKSFGWTVDEMSIKTEEVY